MPRHLHRQDARFRGLLGGPRRTQRPRRQGGEPQNRRRDPHSQRQEAARPDDARGQEDPQQRRRPGRDRHRRLEDDTERLARAEAADGEQRGLRERQHRERPRGHRHARGLALPQAPVEATEERRQEVGGGGQPPGNVEGDRQVHGQSVQLLHAAAQAEEHPVVVPHGRVREGTGQEIARLHHCGREGQSKGKHRYVGNHNNSAFILSCGFIVKNSLNFFQNEFFACRCRSY